MSVDRARAERERLEADRRYNEALTALDRAVVGLSGRTPPTADDVRHVGSVLLVFLQQITAFVDSRDRDVAAAAGARIDSTQPTLDAVAELGQQIAVLQRSVQALRRSPPYAAPPTGSAAGNAPRPVATAAAAAGDDVVYVGFEDRFRGSGDEIADRLRAYLPIFAACTDVLDVGCGRGEFLAILREAGVSARGVDPNEEMIAITRERGLDAQVGDGLDYLRTLPDASLGGLIASQVVEHLPPAYLVAFLKTAYEKLRPGAPIVLETINPTCWLAFFSSYLRDFTHRSAVHPETLQYLLQAVGFSQVSVQYSAPVPEHMKMKPIDLPADIVTATDATARALVETAHVANANAAILNNLMFTHLDYAAIGHRS